MAERCEEIKAAPLWLKNKSRGVGSVAPAGKVKPITLDPAADRLVCNTCGHFVTTLNRRITVAGNHTHRFMNRAGFLFELSCFAEAPGCKTAGEADDDYSWFPGYSWRFALCAACNAHLGWLFEKEDAFFGLINDRLRAAHGSDG